jgi:acyl carrier protein
MKKNEALDALAEMIYAETGISKELVTMEKDLAQLDIDSLSMITILVNTEDACGVKLIDTAAEQASTVGEIVEIIVEQKGGN